MKLEEIKIEDVEIQNAVIKSAIISNDDHGLLSSWLHLDYGGAGQGFGGYALYLPKSFKHHQLLTVAGHWIWRIMEIAEVSNWSELSGKTIRVISSQSKIYAIGHIINDNWFCPEIEFNQE